jgi:hypothetical protein
MIQLDPNPFFRKVIVPWYDTEALCIAVIVLNVFVVLFGLLGILVAWENPIHKEAFWVPVLLVVLASWVILSTGLRLTKRWRRRSSR